MKPLAAIAAMLLLIGAANGQPARPPGPPVRSASGQFVIYAAPFEPAPASLARLASNAGYLSLDPALLAVSCERCKERLARHLNASEPWRGKIYLDLRRARGPDEPITVVLEKFQSVWNVRIKLPDVARREHLILKLTQALLLEMANRQANQHPAAVPAWLIEGCSLNLLAASETDLLLAPPSQSVNGLAFRVENTNTFLLNPLQAAWLELRSQPALTFEQLSWPAEGQLDGDAGLLYRASAQLLVSRLLRLPNGQACLRQMLQDLPRHYNWQLAFQDAFRAQFQSPLDVEKWWALQVVQFTGHDLTQTLTREESWRKFDDILRPPVEVRARQNELPLHTKVSLQTALREWDRTRQIPMLQEELAGLNQLRPQAAAEVETLIEDYCRVIQNYLQQRDRSTGVLFFKKRKSWIYDRLTEDTIQQLDALDAVRQALRPPPAAAGAADGMQAIAP